ncbi:MAG: hypothetical protein ACW98K_02710 [Candidatus Kariarchaeaceae archaeon]
MSGTDMTPKKNGIFLTFNTFLTIPIDGKSQQKCIHRGYRNTGAIFSTSRLLIPIT